MNGLAKGEPIAALRLRVERLRRELAEAEAALRTALPTPQRRAADVAEILRQRVALFAERFRERAITFGFSFRIQ